MISKSEFIELYCDERLFRSTGRVAVDPEKLAARLVADPIKTITDIGEHEEAAKQQQPAKKQLQILSPEGYYNGIDLSLIDWGSENSIGD